MKILLPASVRACRRPLRGMLDKVGILCGLIVAIHVAQASEITEVSKLMRAGQYPEALAKIDAELATHPRDAKMRFIKGLILTEQNRSAEAIAIFSKLTEDFPDLPEPYNNLAVLYAANGQDDKARAMLDMAIRTNPTYATALENLGDVYAKLASKAYDKALQIDPANNAAQTKLTLVRTLTGNVTGGTIPKLAGISKPAAAPAPVPAPAAVVPATPTLTPIPTPAAPAPAPEAKPKPADKPTDKTAGKAATTRDETDKTAVLRAVDNWAKAWSNMDVKSYLAAYASDFQTPRGESRKQWAQERRARIEEKGRISVKVEAVQVALKDGIATVHFRQIYNSSRLALSSRKTLILVKQGNRWLIKQERSGG